MDISFHQTPAPAPDLNRESQSIEEAASRKIWHTTFTFLIGVLLVLIQVKYNNLASLFNEYLITISAFILTIFIYGIGYVLISQTHALRMYSLIKYTIIVSGVISCELALKLVVPMGAFTIINVCVALLCIGLRCRCQETFDMAYKVTHRMWDYIFKRPQNQDTPEDTHQTIDNIA